MWIPLGLIEKDFVPEKELNFCMNSQVNWSKNNTVPVAFDELPTGAEFQDYFELNK